MRESSPAPSPPEVIDVFPESFPHEVVERSREIPVVVDFWAEWCGPCQILSPILEKLAHEYAGKFVLAKVDIERCPNEASDYGIRSIPAVLGIRDGAVVDAFVGLQPEAVIRKWVDRILPTDAEVLAAQARLLEVSNPKAAEEKYGQALELETTLSLAQIGLARIALAQGRIDDAIARITALERRGFLEAEAEKLKAELTLRVQAAGGSSVEAARAALSDNPENLNLMLELAEALASSSQYADALALCLELVERDRRGIGEKARQTMLAIFKLLPPGDELVTEYQRQLSLLL
jgi:putative thioredoxin